jgi:hypothetical protein
MSTTPYQFISRGNLFITPVGPAISEVPYPTQTMTKPREFSLWVNGRVEEPEFQLDKLRMPPSMYQEVRKDLSNYSTIPVSRSAFRRSQHAYVGVIDSLGKPYYFALDSRGFSCREVPINDDHVWKTFDRLAGEEQMMAIQKRRQAADVEMDQVDREMSEPLLVLSKGLRRKGDVIPGGLADKKTPSDFDPKKIKAGIKVEMEHTSSRTIAPCGCRACDDVKKAKYEARKPDGTPVKKPSLYQKLRNFVGKPRTDVTDTGEDAPQLPRATARIKKTPKLLLTKALPKKAKEETVAKPKPTSKAVKKQAGAGGKTRYTYPQEGKAKLPKPTPLVVALPQDEKQVVDPTELANQIGVSMLTLSKIAGKLGRKGFSRYMRSHLKRFAAKHRLGHDYWDQIYGTVVQNDVKNEDKTL